MRHLLLSTKARYRALLAAGAAVLLAWAGVAYALVQPGAPGRGAHSAVTVDRDVQVDHGGPEALVTAQSSPTMAVDPTDPARVLMADRVDSPSFSCRLYRSTDGGRRWSSVPVPVPPGFDTCFAPDVAFAPDGSAYLSYLTLDTSSAGGPAPNTPTGAWLTRSADHGATFRPPTMVLGANQLQLHLAVAPSGRIYLLWLQADQRLPDTPLGLGPPPNPIMVASSTDGGASFSAPVQVNPPDRQRVGGASLAIGPRGALDVLYEDYGRDLADYGNEALGFTGTFSLVLARSTDQGRRFAQTVVDDHVVRTSPFLVYLPPTPSLAVGPGGRWTYVAWQDARAGASDILLRRSGDGGQTWSAPEQLDIRPSRPAAFILPSLSVAHDGRVDAVFLGQVQGRGRELPTDAWYTFSTDHGGSFSRPARLTQYSFDGRVGPDAPRDPGTTDEGTTLAVHSVPSGILAAWPDSLLGDLSNGRQDIFFTRAELR